MGFRLHVATTYKVEWGNAVGFNHKVQEFHSLLDACGCEYSGEYDVDFEVLKDDWRHTIDKLKRLDTLPDDEAGEIEERVKDLQCTTDEVIDKMERLLSMSEPDSDYLHLSFF
ncbi:MAG: hypothetical protein IJG42_03660 [Muribaculaceae bacterium]|nr:hypothetical protein [Muribaculaceae bacterium]